jgi:hypothetical protein
MPKVFNQMSKKDVRAAANDFAALHKRHAGSMMSPAMCGGDKIFAISGLPAANATPSDPYPAYLIEYKNKLPWNGINPVLPRDHNTCAEAHVWCEVIARGKIPKNFILFSFNAQGIIASPCANCAQWVENAFGQVYKETTAYEKHTKQKP